MRNDCTVGADSPAILQSLLDIGDDSSKIERGILQRVKSVVLETLNKIRRSVLHHSDGWDIDGVKMLTVDKTMHVGICRLADTDESAVTENITRARRTMYNLKSARLYRENGLDPETSLHLFKLMSYRLSYMVFIYFIMENRGALCYL